MASFLHFDVSFMLWVLLGALGLYIAEGAGLSDSQKGLVVATPILSGALVRMPLGVLSDRFGSKRVGAGLLAFLFLPLTIGWQAGDSLPVLLGIGLLLGVAGGSFAVALPLVSRWYPPERQGLVMGLAAAGNSGTVIANLLAPWLASMVGWHNVLGLAMTPLALTLAVFVLVAKESPARTRHPASDFGMSKQPDLWWLCFFYSVTFGGYVGLSSFLPLFIGDQYAVHPVTAGYITALAAVAGSATRPIGGYLADRFGGARMLSVLLVGVCATYALMAWQLPLGVLVAVVGAGMACLGMGNGAVFQLVGRRFTANIGAATGIIGTLGGLGGFFVPNLLGTVKDLSGTFGHGFLFLAGIALGAFFVLRVLAAAHAGWRDGQREALEGLEQATTEYAGRVAMVPYLPLATTNGGAQ